MSRTYEMMFSDELERAEFEHAMKREREQRERSEKLEKEIEYKNKCKFQAEKKAANEKKKMYVNNMKISIKFLVEDATLEDLTYFEKSIESKKKKL